MNRHNTFAGPERVQQFFLTQDQARIKMDIYPLLNLSGPFATPMDSFRNCLILLGGISWRDDNCD
jgi:hypothetical protein